MILGVYPINSVINTDALSLLKGLPDQSVDALISDPPYELTELDFDQQVIDWAAWWVEVKRVLKQPSSPVVLFSQQPFTTDLINSNRKWYRYEIIYEKTMPTGYLNASRRPLRCHENIEIFSEADTDYYPVFDFVEPTADRIHRENRGEHYGDHGKSSTWTDTGKRYPRSVWKYAQRDTAFANTVSLHPTAKPLLLMERLVETFSEAGDLVVDCFAGSGTTGAAAVKLERKFIGSDNGIDKKTGRSWADISNERIALPYTPRMFEETL